MTKLRYELNYDCNYNCRFCHHDQVMKCENGDTLSAEDYSFLTHVAKSCGINKITLSENGVEFCNYRFQNSIDNKFIQVSDLFCGLLGKLFYYLDSISEKELPQIRSKLNDVQKSNFRHIYELINKSDKKCPLFLKNANAAGNINSRIKKLIILSF